MTADLKINYRIIVLIDSGHCIRKDPSYSFHCQGKRISLRYKNSLSKKEGRTLYG